MTKRGGLKRDWIWNIHEMRIRLLLHINIKQGKARQQCRWLNWVHQSNPLKSSEIEEPKSNHYILKKRIYLHNRFHQKKFISVTIETFFLITFLMSFSTRSKRSILNSAIEFSPNIVAITIKKSKRFQRLKKKKERERSK